MYVAALKFGNPVLRNDLYGFPVVNIIVFKVALVLNLAASYEACGGLILTLIVPGLLLTPADLPMRKEPWWSLNRSLDHWYH
jgi:uncharacterized membrane protein